jgi:hypothetical protein
MQTMPEQKMAPERVKDKIEEPETVPEGVKRAALGKAMAPERGMVPGPEKEKVQGRAMEAEPIPFDLWLFLNYFDRTIGL